MLINCTRLTTSWTSLRVIQLRRSTTNISCQQQQIYLLKSGILKTKVPGTPSQQLHRQLFTALTRTTPTVGHHSSIMLQRSRLFEQARRIRQQLMRFRSRTSGPQNKLNANEKIPHVKVNKSDFLRILKLAKSEKYVLLAALGCLIISSAITMSVPLVLGKMIDVIFNKSGLDETSMTKLRTFSFLLFLVFIIGGLANFARVYLFNSASLRIVRNLRSRVYHTMLMQESGWFDTKGSGELIQRLVNDTFFVGNSLSQNLSDGFRSLAMISVGTGMMVYTSPKLALVSLLVVPGMAGMAIVYGRYVRRVTRALLDKFAEISKYAEERFANIRTVKTFSRELDESKTYDALLDDVMALGYKEARAKSIFFGLTGFSGNVIIISVLYYGGTLVLDNALTIGQLTSFLLYAGYAAISMNGISNFYSELNKGIGAAQRVWEILDRKYAIPIDVGLVPLNRPNGEIIYDNVFFKYPSRPDTTILNGFSLKLQPGSTTAIVGRSGTGKTTVASLILRLYDPVEGSVLLDGTDIRTLSPLYLRRYISAVTQEPVLFSGTIRDNILYGLNANEEVSEELLQNVVSEAHVDEFATQLPLGLETLVGQRGVMLSGGQKQRVAIARALIKNPIILILDEATSALDAVSEQLVQQALDRLVQGRTVLTIAHRLSTIRHADNIAVLDQGVVVEEGSYDHLMSLNDGAFRELVAKQAFAMKSP